MSAKWPMVPLGEVLRKNEECVELQPDHVYREVTVRLWGRGVVLRREVEGVGLAGARRVVVRSGQFILSRIDSRHGAIAIVPDVLDGAVVSNDFPSFWVDESRVDPHFLGWMSRTAWFVDLCRAASEGTTNRVRLQEGKLLEAVVPLPPLPEQRRIVPRLGRLSERLDASSNLRRTATAQINALADSVARRRLSALEMPRTSLNEWLAESAVGIQTGPFGAELSSQDFVEVGVPVLTIGNIQYGGLDLDHLRHVSEEKAAELGRYRIRAGDLLFARMGTVGRCSVVPPEAEGWLFNYHIIRVSLDRTRINPRFLLWTIRASEDVSAYLEETIRGATRQGVNSTIVGAIPCRVPSLSEQSRIVSRLEMLAGRIESLRRLEDEISRELRALFLGSLESTLSGEVMK